MSRELLSRSSSTSFLHLSHRIYASLLAGQTRFGPSTGDHPLLMSRRLQHDIILDYVSSAAYSSTARSLAQSSRPRRPGSTPVPDPGVTGNGAGYAREAGDAAIPLQDGKGDGGMDVDVDVDMESMTDGKGKGSGSGLSKMTAGTLEAGAGATEGGTGGIVLDEQKLASIEWRRGERLLCFLTPTRQRSSRTTWIHSAPGRRSALGC
jgi:hypothetical protein